MRIKNILRNCATGFLNQLLKEILRFLVRTVFIYRLSEEFLGANGLFTSVLNVLNIAELGIGGAIAFALYKPLAEQDKEEIKSLMAMYRKAYQIIGLVIFGAGLCLIPILPLIVKQRIEGLNLYILYLLYLVNSVVSYFFFAYKANLLVADQKNYIVTLFSSIVSILTALVQIIVLLIMPAQSAISFYVYTFVSVLGSIVTNLFVSYQVDRIYPYIKEKDIAPVSDEIRKKIFRNIGALSVSRISRVALDSIDSIIISATLVSGLSIIGKYSNYTMIVSVVNSVFGMLSTSITSSLGNFLAKKEIQDSRRLFNSIDLLFKWLYGFCFVCLWTLLNPFIGGVWITEEWLLSDNVVFLICINFLLNGVIFAPMKYIQAAGLYWQARYRYILSAVLNIGLSILFGVVLGWGLEGVILATTIALVGMTCLDPYVVFKHLFRDKVVSYYLSHLCSFFGIVLTGGLTVFICQNVVPAFTLHNFVIRIFICIVVPNALWLLLLWRTKTFQSTVALLRTYVKMILKI